MRIQTADTSRAQQEQISAARRWRRLREISLGYTLLAPALLLLLVFEFFPVFFGLYISTCDWRLRCVAFVGTANYARALQDPDMWHSLLITAAYALLSIILQLSLGLFLAYLLFQKIRGKELLRVLFFLPYVTSTVASAAVWSYLYSPDNGLFNTLLRHMGLPTLGWLNDPRLALFAVIAYTTWVFVGYDITIFLAGLGNIPAELYDAAKVDGASNWVLFRNITLPLLSPTTYFLLIFTVIGTFQAFNHIYVMTQGGPGDSTTTASIFIFRQLYENLAYGYSAALSFILFSVILVLTGIQNRVFGRRVVYE